MKHPRILEKTDTLKIGNIILDISKLKPDEMYYIFSYFDPEIQLEAVHVEILKDTININKKYPINRLCGVLKTNQEGTAMRFSCNINQA